MIHRQQMMSASTEAMPLTVIDQQTTEAPPAVSAVIVDCGSGYSRVANFQQQNASIQAVTTKSNIAALHTVIHCRKKSLEWLHQLVDIVKHVHDHNHDNRTHVLIGATGGVRDLVSSGEITTKELDVFRELLLTAVVKEQRLVPFDATLRVLSGEEEAKYEFLAVEYCAHQCGYADESTTLGLLSSGGMSSQMYVKGGCGQCVETQIKKGNKLGLEYGMVRGMALYSLHVEEAMRVAAIPEDFGKESDVLYIAIEMLAGVGEKAGVGGIVMTVAKAMDVLSSFIESEVEEDKKRGNDERTWRTYVYVMSGIVGKVILERLHPDSRILFLREFKLADNHSLKPSWPLGCAIDSLGLEER